MAVRRQDPPPTQEAPQAAEQGRSLPEKVTLFVSLGVVLGLIGFIAWHGVFVEKGKPAVEVRALAGKAWQQGDQWTIPIEIRNDSDLPLEDVQVKVEMTTPDGDRADVAVEAAYLAVRGVEEAYVLSELPPRQAGIVVRVESFKTREGGRGY